MHLWAAFANFVLDSTRESLHPRNHLRTADCLQAWGIPCMKLLKEWIESINSANAKKSHTKPWVSFLLHFGKTERTSIEDDIGAR